MQGGVSFGRVWKPAVQRKGERMVLGAGGQNDSEALEGSHHAGCTHGHHVGDAVPYMVVVVVHVAEDDGTHPVLEEQLMQLVFVLQAVDRRWKKKKMCSASRAADRSFTSQSS